MGRHYFSHYQKSSQYHLDWVILVCLLLLGFIGLFVLLTTNLNLFWQQLGFLAIGAIIMYALSRLDPIMLWWAAPYGYALSLLFLASSYLGPSIRGASRWIVIGDIQLQPSEIVKPLVILALARITTTYSPRSARWLILHGLVFFVPFILVFRQPDLGTSIVYGFSWLSMIIAGGFPVLFLVLSSIVGVFLIPFFWKALENYQKSRILTFLNPAIDPQGAGYNAIQAMIAVGSGQLFGRGLGHGTQSHLRFLPEYHTDFIYATLVEELGFVGGAVLLSLYIILLWQLIAPYMRRSIGNPFVFFYTVGVFGMLLTQIVINAGMNMGLVPVTGITLPFVSYGGSSIVSLCIAFGLLFALRRADGNDRSIAIG